MDSGATFLEPVPLAPRRPPFECIALLLQGGGALGAYQGGVYEALAEAGLHPDWVAGISIGAVNSAIIAGNSPNMRVEKLRSFWEDVTAPPLPGLALGQSSAKGDVVRGALSSLSAAWALMNGAPGFFAPRLPGPWLQPTGTPEATSYYDTAALGTTLERLVDFERVNRGETRLSIGAVNVRSGNFVYFDTTRRRIGPEHVMASGALPPGFPAVEIEGESYWDGGLVSNTPLQWVLENDDGRDTLAFQVDLWSARGELPLNVPEVMTRQKEIQYSSRTRANTDWLKKVKQYRWAIAGLLEQLPAALQKTPEAELLRTVAERNAYNIVQLIYRAKDYEGHSKDFEFSRASMEDHWRAGYCDTVRTLRHQEVLAPARTNNGVFTFDLAQDGRE